MKFKEICKIGYQALLVTVTIIEAVELGKTLCGKVRNRKSAAPVIVQEPAINDSKIEGEA